MKSSYHFNILNLRIFLFQWSIWKFYLILITMILLTGNHMLNIHVATLLWGKCEDETHTPEIGTWESSGTLETSKFNYRGQNISHRGVIYIIEKLLKCRCRKWPHIGHLWRVPKSFVELTWGFNYVGLRKVGTWGPLSTSSTKRG